MLLFERKILTLKYLQTQQNGNSYISGVGKKQCKRLPHTQNVGGASRIYICVSVQILKGLIPHDPNM